MITFTKKVSEEDIDRLQAAQYKFDAARNIMVTAIADMDIDISNDRFKLLNQDYTDKYVLYEVLKNSVIADYISPNIRITDLNWNIDYRTATLTVDLAHTPTDKDIEAFKKEGFTVNG